MRKLLPLCCWHSWLLLFYGEFQVCGAHSRSGAHPGFEVLASASHYWPLENVDGIHELQDTTRGTYDLTVLPSHDSTFVYTNGPTYSNLSATVDIVEGKINKGIYLKEEKGVTLLYYGRYKTSCISNPAQCGPEGPSSQVTVGQGLHHQELNLLSSQHISQNTGASTALSKQRCLVHMEPPFILVLGAGLGVTFSFFWKTQEQSRPSPSAYGGQVISSGFKVCSSGGKGLVELYMRENSMTWEASFNPPGPYWTHVLFTWKSKEGLKVYVNGTLSTSDPSGKVAHAYGEPGGSLVMGPEQEQAQRHESRAFDEFIVWERALTPDEIAMYFTAAVGKHVFLSSTPPSFFMTLPANAMMPTNAYHPIIANLTEERKNFQSPDIALNYLQNVSLSLPNKHLSEETALNLTETFLKTVGKVLQLPSWIHVSEDNTVVLGLIDTVDTVMGHIAYNLHTSEPQVTITGSSSIAEFSLARVLPKTMNSTHYRFPAQGQSYIEIPHEAFHSQAWTTIVGLLYRTVHGYLNSIQPANTRIAEAAKYKHCLLSVTSHLISLEVSPAPTLSQNLSDSPLITVHLRHKQTGQQYSKASNASSRTLLYCAFLDFSSGEGVWSDQGCALIAGNLSYSVCRCTHLTNFAILMQVVPLELTVGHQVALSSISYVGCSLSVLCLAVTLVTFAMLSSVSTIRNQRYHIHANLSFAVLVAQVLLLLSSHFKRGTVPCRVLAVLLHYFFLGTFAWMLVEGLHLYSMVIKVFGSEDSKHLYYYGIGWGLPLLICTVSISFAMDSYGTSNNCWLSLESGAIWAFVGPALAVIVVNTGILIAVTRVISQISADNYKMHGDPNAFRLTAKAVAVLLPLLGTSWGFGVLAVNSQAVVFQYVFAILNSSQGFFIFLFHCLLNSEVRAAFKHKTKVWSLASSSARNTNVKPFNSDLMNGTRPGMASTKLSPWDTSSHSVQRVDLSAV